MTIATQAPAIALLAVSVLVVFNFALTVSGLFPARDSARVRFGQAGTAGLYVMLALVALLALHAAIYAATHTAWYFAVIATGLMLLAAPWVHRLLPRPIQDGLLGVFVIGGLTVALHLALFAA